MFLFSLRFFILFIVSMYSLSDMAKAAQRNSCNMRCTPLANSHLQQNEPKKNSNKTKRTHKHACYRLLDEILFQESNTNTWMITRDCSNLCIYVAKHNDVSVGAMYLWIVCNITTIWNQLFIELFMNEINWIDSYLKKKTIWINKKNQQKLDLNSFLFNFNEHW